MLIKQLSIKRIQATKHVDTLLCSTRRTLWFLECSCLIMMSFGSSDAGKKLKLKYVDETLQCLSAPWVHHWCLVIVWSQHWFILFHQHASSFFFVHVFVIFSIDSRHITTNREWKGSLWMSLVKLSVVYRCRHKSWFNNVGTKKKPKSMELITELKQVDAMRDCLRIHFHLANVNG